MPIDPFMILVLLASVAAAACAAWAALSAQRATRIAEAAGQDDRASVALAREMAALRGEFDAKAATQRLELSQALNGLSDSLDRRIGALTTNFDTRLQAAKNGR